MGNTLLLHVGAPKTGTTALQNFLLDNNAILEKYRWCYPILNNHEISVLERWELETIGNGYKIYDANIVNDMKSVWEHGMDIVLKLLENKNVIISTEYIYERGTEKFLQDVKKKYANVKVVVYLRRQDRVLESRYNQYVKSGVEYDTFQKFLDSDYIPEGLLDYMAKLDSISSIIGKENLIVRVYEKQQLIGNDIITDFLSVIGVPLKKDEWKRNERENGSLEGNFLEINRLINSVRDIEGILESRDGAWSWSDWNVATDIKYACMKLSSAIKQDKDECGFFSLDERKKFLEQFAIDNKKVARKYLHREDGMLFFDTRMEYPMYEVNQSTNFEADMLRFFSAMMYIQDRRVKSLLKEKDDKWKEKYCKLSGKLLVCEAMIKSKNRELMFFGAGQNCEKLFHIVGDISGVSIVDNDPKKKGMKIADTRVKYVKDIINWKEYFILVTSWKTDEIEEQLCGLGLVKGEDYILMREYDI